MSLVSAISGLDYILFLETRAKDGAMTKEELRENCKLWVHANRGIHYLEDHMTDSLLKFVTTKLGAVIATSVAAPPVKAPAPKPTLLVQDPKKQSAAPIASTRPRMDISGTKLKWAK
jgi:hypothetical protein